MHKFSPEKKNLCIHLTKLKKECDLIMTKQNKQLPLVLGW